MGRRRSMPAAMLHGTPRSTACTATAVWRPQLALVPSTCASFGNSKAACSQTRDTCNKCTTER